MLSNNKKWLALFGAAMALAGLAWYFIFSPHRGKQDDAAALASENETLVATAPLLQSMSAAETGIDFRNSIEENEQNNVLKNINFYNGGGVCTGDLNADGLTDVYFVSCNGKNKLYMNQGNFKFTENAEAAGVSSEDGFESGATLADVNADGFLDIFVCRSGPKGNAGRGCKLFINTPSKPGYFTEMAAAFGLNDPAPVTGAVFFDYDNDGDLDCYLLNHPENLALSNELLLKPDAKGDIYADLEPKQLYDSDRFYRNDSPSGNAPNGIKTTKFTDISRAAGIYNLGFGLSVSVSDLNFDGYLDVYVANDFLQPDNMYINNRNGGFDDKLKSSLKHNSVFTMGVDLDDFDNDGLVDIFSLDMLPSKNYRQKLSKTTNPLSRYLSLVQSGLIEPVTRNTLQRNNGNGTFSDVACLAGIYKTDWSWSCLMSDLDNDGLKDIYITNGYPKDVNARDFHDFVLPEVTKKMPLMKLPYSEVSELLRNVPAYKSRNFVYRNQGNWQFEDVSGKWATMTPSWSCGSAWADLDNDGDLDLVVNNLEDPAFVYKNLAKEQNTGNHLQVKLQGDPNNSFAVGASVLIECQGQKQFQEMCTNRGAFSSSEHLIHFGLGKTQNVDRLTVRWPDGKTQTLANVAANQRLNLQYKDASAYTASLVAPVTSEGYFKDISSQLNLSFKHQENDFVDFERWQLNPWSVSDLGPLAAVGDVNGDGLDDFFIGNAFDQPAALYVQSKQGGFSTRSEKLFETYKNYEDNEAIFFDADGDKDLDLFITSGGPDATSDLAFQFRLYINDGNGNFTNETTDRLPVLKDIGLRAVAYDFDKDGDLDIFVGGRVKPNLWPLTPRSVVLQNNGGKFTDVSEAIGGDFTNCGMVTDLHWKDINGDGQDELIVVGEWMPLSIFALKSNKLQNITAQFGLENSNGLWQKMCLADLDGDGDTDIITGNIGINTRLTAPLYCYAKDFDQNGSLDPIVAFEENGKIYPLMQKDVLVKQMPVLKKKFLYSKDYASATVDMLWPAAALKESFQVICRDLESSWWENQQGKFVKHVLPIQAQASVVQGIIARDFNGDGKIDILLAGNKYGFEVETNQSDAGNGALFIGDGKGNFTWVDNLKSGFWANREARELSTLSTGAGKPIILVSNNNGKPQFFQMR